MVEGFKKQNGIIRAKFEASVPETNSIRGRDSLPVPAQDLLGASYEVLAQLGVRH